MKDLTEAIAGSRHAPISCTRLNRAVAAHFPTLEGPRGGVKIAANNRVDLCGPSAPPDPIESTCFFPSDSRGNVNSWTILLTEEGLASAWISAIAVRRHPGVGNSQISHVALTQLGRTPSHVEAVIALILTQLTGVYRSYHLLSLTCDSVSSTMFLRALIRPMPRHPATSQCIRRSMATLEGNPHIVRSTATSLSCPDSANDLPQKLFLPALFFSRH